MTFSPWKVPVNWSMQQCAAVVTDHHMPKEFPAFFIEIILGLLLLGLLQIQLSFACLSFSCPWFFEGHYYEPLHIWLLNKTVATPVWLYQYKTLLLGGKSRKTAFLPLQHICIIWVHGNSTQMQATQLHPYRNLMQRKSSLPLEIIVPQSKCHYNIT